MPVYKIRVLATAGGVACQNVLHTQSATTDATAVAQDFADAWRKHLVAPLASTYQFAGVEAEDIATDDAAGYSAGTTGPTVGADVNAPGPTFVCASVRLKTSRRGRAGAGRFGLGPLPETFTSGDGNYLNAGAQGTLATALTAWQADLESSGDSTFQTLMVVSYFKGVDAAGKPIRRAEPLVTLVDSLSVNAVLGTRLSRHPNR